MTKVKEKLYEHRFGLFFFAVLIGYNFIANSFKWGEITEITYSYHVVDFSIGFCSKLLPGAICNFLFDEITYEKLYVYLSVLMIICFALISALLQKAIQCFKKENQIRAAIFIMLLLTGSCTFAFYFEYLMWFDFYWLFFAVLSFFALMKKETYILVVPLMLSAIMCHYAVIICYVPFIAIVMLYKISVMKKNAEKRYLWFVWVLFVVSCLSLSFYFITYEPENVKMTLEELNSFLASKGISEESFEYYNFAFFRDDVIEKLNDPATNIYSEQIKDIDTGANSFSVFIQLFIQQIFVTLTIADIRLSVEYLLLLAPLVYIIYRIILIDFSLDKSNKLKRFSIICAMLLFWVTLILGRFLSTDTIRWLANALIPLFSFLLYLVYKSTDNLKLRINEYLSGIPEAFIGIYYVIYFLSAI